MKGTRVLRGQGDEGYKRMGWMRELRGQWDERTREGMTRGMMGMRRKRG